MARFDQNGDLWIPVNANLGKALSWVWPMVAIQHGEPGNAELNLTAYMRSARHRNWVNHAMHPDKPSADDRD
ncbi:hypothetical protein [Bradyrhizobium sp. Ai1a-2]|uniref:hypothetical protein n=1 Tax=Bradyrhizobium sp. Ai1a-2 TaxID=196490 RepID=UPI0003FB827D|nr:hypothetical protein [Bradyrhizobium sp. Ai1a-2]